MSIALGTLATYQSLLIQSCLLIRLVDIGANERTGCDEVTKATLVRPTGGIRHGMLRFVDCRKSG